LPWSSPREGKPRYKLNIPKTRGDHPHAEHKEKQAGTLKSGIAIDPTCINPLYRPAMPSGNRKIYFRGSFQLSILSQFQKYHPSGKLKFNNLGIFQSLKLLNLMGKIIPISLKLNFTPNTLGCYGFI